MYTLILLRHGESQWNLENRFTGWTDIDLTSKGKEEAWAAGEILKQKGYNFDVIHTSILTRAINTMNLCLEAMDKQDISIIYNWRLNERHYGALQGLNKAETAREYGERQVHIWRRSYDTPPPALELNDERHPQFDPRYKELTAEELPETECLKDTVERFLPHWKEQIAPDVSSGKRVLIVAHGNSLRALVKYLDNISNEEITGLNIPTGVPLIYELDEELQPSNHYYLGDPNEIAKKAAAVVAQGKMK